MYLEGIHGQIKMPNTSTIALDAMGGDQAPRIIIAGADVARQRYPNSHFLIFGDADTCTPLLRRFSRLESVAEVVHTEDMVAADAKPSVAVRRGRKSSMWLAINSVADGRADAVVSAGNTGALMAMSKLLLKTLPGISRPAIAGVIPTRRSESVFLDLGANIECGPENLIEFALMGAILARAVLGVVRPTVGLLNVGEEEFKGREELREVARVLRSADMLFDFHGFVEGDDLTSGTTDVVVTDGFTGNIALKALEGVSKAYSDFLRRSLRSSLSARLGALLARPAFKSLSEKVDPRRHNGAMFVGLNGIAVKSHGGTDSLGFANAIGVAVDIIVQGVNERIITELSRLQPADSA